MDSKYAIAEKWLKDVLPDNAGLIKITTPPLEWMDDNDYYVARACFDFPNGRRFIVIVRINDIDDRYIIEDAGRKIMMEYEAAKAVDYG